MVVWRKVTPNPAHNLVLGDLQRCQQRLVTMSLLNTSLCHQYRLLQRQHRHCHQRLRQRSSNLVLHQLSMPQTRAC